jgi:hypothetical protein
MAKAVALAFSYLEPGQSQYWAVTNGLAWPGLNGLGLAWLTALSQAGHITSYTANPIPPDPIFGNVPGTATFPLPE